MSQITHWICDILENIDDQSVEESVKGKVLELCSRFPVYREA
jgi:glycine hydroxymethyltransferase